MWETAKQHKAFENMCRANKTNNDCDEFLPDTIYQFLGETSNCFVYYLHCFDIQHEGICTHRLLCCLNRGMPNI